VGKVSNKEKIIYDIALSFDDVLIHPGKSDVIPAECDVKSYFSRNVPVKIPIASAAMDTVTERQLAIALAKEGGIGVIHKNLTIEQQAKEVDAVKRYQLLVIENPVCVYSDMTFYGVSQLKGRKGVSYNSFPVVKRSSGKLCGFLTKDHFKHARPNEKVSDVMLKIGHFHNKGEEWIGNPEAVYGYIRSHLSDTPVDKLVITDGYGRPTHMYDMDNLEPLFGSKEPYLANVDSKGRLIVGAAVGVNDDARADELVAAGADVIVVDTAHGHSKNVIEAIKRLKKRYDIDLVAGNVATYEGARDLAKAGADAIKVGIGPGSICTTRIVAGAGVPQLTAIMDCARAAKRYKIPIIADGGIRDENIKLVDKHMRSAGFRNSGDITKAIAAGADCVMVGSLLAGTEESPSEKIYLGGSVYKCYRGMGSLGSLKKKLAADRYRQKNSGKLVPEGVEGIVPYKGLIKDLVYQLAGGLRSGMGYANTRNIYELKTKARFRRISSAALRESHPHNITITQTAPNYFG